MKLRCQGEAESLFAAQTLKSARARETMAKKISENVESQLQFIWREVEATMDEVLG